MFWLMTIPWVWAGHDVDDVPTPGLVAPVVVSTTGIKVNCPHSHHGPILKNKIIIIMGSLNLWGKTLPFLESSTHLRNVLQVSCVSVGVDDVYKVCVCMAQPSRTVYEVVVEGVGDILVEKGSGRVHSWDPVKLHLRLIFGYQLLASQATNLAVNISTS